MLRPVVPSEETSTRGSHTMRLREASPACKSLGAFAVEATKNRYMRAAEKRRGRKRGRVRGRQ